MNQTHNQQSQCSYICIILFLAELIIRRMNKPFYGTASLTNSQRPPLINTQYSLGPGSYDVNKQKYSSLPKWTLKKKIEHGSCFQRPKQNIPPPGSYEVCKDIKQRVKLKNPNYRSQKHRHIIQKAAPSSPLNLPGSINLKTGSVFGYREQVVVREHSPGPIYNVDSVVQENRTIKMKNTCRGFGFGQRNGIYKSNDTVPGPGAYEQRQPSESKQKLSPANSTFGKSPKKYYSQTNPLGPGQYNPAMNNSSRSFKLKGKFPQCKKQIYNTGPGSYDLPGTFNKQGTRFNNHQHKSRQNLIGDSPFSYDYMRYPECLDKTAGFSLGKRIQNKLNLSERKPGPGSYQIQQDLSKIHSGGYMGRKIIQKKKITSQDTFCKYDPNLNASYKEGSKFSFSQQPKPWNKQKDDHTIGPAFYTVKQTNSGQKFTMGTSQRFRQLKKQPKLGYKQKDCMYSTIGYLPSYLRKKKCNTLQALSKISKGTEKEGPEASSNQNQTY